MLACFLTHFRRCRLMANFNVSLSIVIGLSDHCSLLCSYSFVKIWTIYTAEIALRTLPLLQPTRKRLIFHTQSGLPVCWVRNHLLRAPERS
jgi:hypothetical protein